MEPIYIFGIVVVAVLAIIYGVAHFRKQINTKKFKSVSEKAFNIAEMFLNANVFDFNNSTKKEIAFVLDIAHDISDFVVKLTDDDINKNELSLESIKRVLEKLNINVTDDEDKLIKLVVAEIIKVID